MSREIEMTRETARAERERERERDRERERKRKGERGRARETDGELTDRTETVLLPWELPS